MKFHNISSIDFRSVTLHVQRAFVALKRYPKSLLEITKNPYFSQHCVFMLILYAPRMPADPFARSVFIRSLYSRSLPSKRHANAHTLGGGDQGTQRRGPRGPGTARGRTRAARAHGRTRALRARWGPSGPWAPSGPKGTAYTQQKLCQTE